MDVLKEFYSDIDIKSEYMRWHEENGDIRRYRTSDLIDCAEDLPIFDIPLQAINCDVKPWDIEVFSDFLDEMARIRNADLQYPIILGPTGSIVNGYHRIAKAMYLGNDTIKAVRLKKLPEEYELITKED